MLFFVILFILPLGWSARSSTTKRSSTSTTPLKECHESDLPDCQAIFQCSKILWSKFTLNVSSLDPTTFMDWSDAVEQIEANVLIEKTQLTRIGFKNLNVLSGSFIVKNNEKLTKINLHTLTNELFLIGGNPQLENVTFFDKHQKSIKFKNFTISGNANLKRIEMLTDKQIIFEEKLLIENNSNLEEIVFIGPELRGKKLLVDSNLGRNLSLNLTSFKSFQVEMLQINNNKELLAVEFNHTGKINIKGVLDVSRNGQLKSLNLPSIGRLNELKLENNPALENLNFPGNISPGRKMIIRGNARMKEEDIGKLRDLASYKSIIQQEGECIFDSLNLTNLTALDPCHYVEGNLNFAVNLTGTTTAKLLRVTGNLNLQNLTKERLTFLRKTTVTGLVSSNLCEFDAEGLFSNPVEVKKSCASTNQIEATTILKPTIISKKTLAAERAKQKEKEKEEAERGKMTAIIVGTVCSFLLVIIVALTVFACTRSADEKKKRTVELMSNNCSEMTSQSPHLSALLEPRRYQKEELQEDQTQQTLTQKSKEETKK